MDRSEKPKKRLWAGEMWGRRNSHGCHAAISAACRPPGHHQGAGSLTANCPGAGLTRDRGVVLITAARRGQDTGNHKADREPVNAKIAGKYEGNAWLPLGGEDVKAPPLSVQSF